MLTKKELSQIIVTETNICISILASTIEKIKLFDSDNIFEPEKLEIAKLIYDLIEMNHISIYKNFPDIKKNIESIIKNKE
jgi:hypothetical protein